MQLAIPKLRTSSNIKSFNTQLNKQGYDLVAWRKRERLSPKDTALLDANNGAGWELASALLRPRNIQVGLVVATVLEYLARYLALLEGSQNDQFACTTEVSSMTSDTTYRS